MTLEPAQAAASETSQSFQTSQPSADAQRPERRRALRRAWLAWREWAALAALIALAAGLRLTLAARGWPILNSDEATMGLMGSDVALRGSRPIFTYAQDYIGALQAYLAAPLDALLGPTPLALRVVTTLEMVAFLLVVYALARALWSPAVALLSVALLALGPEWALLRELQAGAAAQETLLFGALVVWLAYLRLRAGQARPRRALLITLALDLAVGLAVGLGLWSDFLFLPYVAAALLALTCLGLRDVRVGALRLSRALGEAALGVVGFLIGAAPFIVANISSHGRTLSHALALAQAHNGAAPGLGQRLALFGWQIGATLLVGLPQALGSGTVCPDCAVWPQSGVSVTPGQLAQELALTLPFALVAIALWLWTALPLARAIRRCLPLIVAQRRSAAPALPPLNARWWGRLMLALGGALTLLQYVVSRTSYTFPASSARYLIGLYICAPLMIAPLAPACAALWRRRGSRERRVAALAAPLGTALLLALFVLQGISAAHALAATADRQTYGQPMGQRDARLVAFLQAHHSAEFYAGYWTCVRLVFTSRQQVNCAVIDPDDAFRPGFNRYPPAVRRTAAAPHPAWIFDLARGEEGAQVPAQVAACIATGEPRCVGYTSATVDDYLIFYYAGPSAP
ncbi:MAG TPA: hypothetical protein VHI51_21920 [Ktedonobacterales bacterium]|jgi:uncharacterized membrane protein|nr:hypothetical protein [Ktedonobacterales bacterium]